MSYFTIEYLGFHQIAYAHELTASDYHFSFSTEGFGDYRARESETSGVFEIGYVEKNPLLIENHTLGETYTAEEGDIFVFPPNHEISVHTVTSGEHKHITSEYMIDARVEIHRGVPFSEAESLGFGNRMALPYLISSENAGRDLVNRIHKIAAEHTLLFSKSYFKQSAEFCSLMEALRRSSDPVEVNRSYLSPKYKANCKKAEEFIERNIVEQIHIQQIADEVGLSKNYLINIFPKYKGMGLSEYINRVKLNRVVLMMTRYGYTMKQACESVGYKDLSYVSRIFSKYYGVSLTSYLQMHFPPPDKKERRRSRK